MTFDQFHNGLRILRAIDRHELVEAQVIAAGDDEAWMNFQLDPYRFFIRADDTTAWRLWTLIESRQPTRKATA